MDLRRCCERSFAQVYRKTKRNVEAASQGAGFTSWDPPDDDKRDLLRQLITVAQSAGLRMAVCSQRNYLIPGSADARCVDADRLAEIGGRPIRAKLKGNRPDCGCSSSRQKVAARSNAEKNAAFSIGTPWLT